MLKTMLGNSWTTVFGFAAAIFTYFAQLGPNLPRTKGEWMQALVAASIAALGVASKDATTGSKPGV